MIDFHRSSFTFQSHPRQRDEYYQFPGGFVGTLGEIYHVRFKIDAMCTLVDEASGQRTELFIGAPCRTEYTIASRNLFQIPSSEFRLAFSRDWRVSIAARPSDEQEAVQFALPLSEAFTNHHLALRSFANATTLDTAARIAQATLAGEMMNARSTYRDETRGLQIIVDYPVNLININVENSEFQVCTGPVILPDLGTWDGKEVSRVFLAHAAFSAFDHVEFILQREVEAAPEARAWLEQPRGRDRLALHDPSHQPPGYPPPRPRPTVYYETWELPGQNTVFAAVID